jgi:hypothetical protein
MSDLHQSSDPSAPIDCPELPSLRIHHLMAWMAVTAVLISLTRWFERTARNGPPIDNDFVIGALVIVAVGISGALTFAGYGLSWRATGHDFPAEPGQWLLFEVAVAVCGVIAWVIGSFIIFWIEEDWLEVLQPGFGIMLLIAFALMNIYIGWKRADTHAWKVTILSLNVIAFLTLFFLFWAVWDDRRRRLARHWTHWLGVSVLFVWLVLAYASIVWDEFL